ncbi:hypothetical protein CEXT_296501, partial [Caerostris extrusa]
HDVQLYRQKNNELELFTTLKEGHTDFVRTISKFMNRKYVTGGEDGQLCFMEYFITEFLVLNVICNKRKFYLFMPFILGLFSENIAPNYRH